MRTDIFFYPPSLSESCTPFQGICLRHRSVFVTFSHFSSPLHPSFTNMNCMRPGRCWRAGRDSSTDSITAWNTGVTRLSHFSQPRDKALTLQLRLVPFSSIESQGHSPIARVKVIGWQPHASCIWMTDAPSAPLQNANTQASFSALFFCLKGQPCQTLHGISSTCWLQSDDLCKTIIEMQVIAAESSQPNPHPTTLLLFCLITFCHFWKLQLDYIICMLLCAIATSTLNKDCIVQ